MGSPTRSVQSHSRHPQRARKHPHWQIAGKKVAAFDTRLLMTGVKGLALSQDHRQRRVMRLHLLIAGELVSKGGTLALPAEGFFVKGEEGPLVNAELERATEWGKKLV